MLHAGGSSLSSHPACSRTASLAAARTARRYRQAAATGRFTYEQPAPPPPHGLPGADRRGRHRPPSGMRRRARPPRTRRALRCEPGAHGGTARRRECSNARRAARSPPPSPDASRHSARTKSSIMSLLIMPPAKSCCWPTYAPSDAARLRPFRHDQRAPAFDA